NTHRVDAGFNLWATLLAGFAALLCAAEAQAAMKIRALPVNNLNAQSDTYDRFNNSPTWIGNPANWSAPAPAGTSAYPWAAVGRDATLDRWATLISPSFIISASHFSPGDGNTINFYTSNDPNADPEQRTVIASEQLDAADYPLAAGYVRDGPGVSGDIGDVWIGELSQPVTDIASFKILNRNSPADFNGLTISTFGLSTDLPGTATSIRLGRNVVTNAQQYTQAGSAPIQNSWAYQFTYDNPGLGPDESQVIVGDSGGPSFFLYGGGAPALVGLHWANNATGGPETATISEDTLLSQYINDIKTGMGQLAALPQSAANLSAPSEALQSISTKPILGDFNLDGQVTNADLQAMLIALKNINGYQTSHGMNAAYLDDIGDFNGDFVVNAADLKGMLTLLATGSSGGGGGLSTVPEPASGMLLGLGFLALASLNLWRSRLSPTGENGRYEPTKLSTPSLESGRV
ncbi:MAG TPA: PEP-CTERM sorting domain-containing protein, partial [Pirellulales bacterium]